MLIATLHAVGNIDQDVTAYARTLGVPRARIHRSVVMPAIVPELAGTFTLCVPLAWSVLLTSEIYGVQEGLGWMMGEALRFTLVDRITLIAAAFILADFVTMQAARRIVAGAARWTE